MVILLFASSSQAGFRDTWRAERFCSQVVQTGEGPVRGLLADEVDDCYACAYKGIPYAAPPVGELRWQPPQPAPVRNQVLVADDFGADCIQCELIGEQLTTSDADETSEDCLFLNIWRPAEDGVFPVMVWIHGGAFQNGSAAQTIYDSASLAARQHVVVVSINYRMGVFGYLAHPDLVDPDDGYAGGSAGNYGMLDQVAALEWVRENISQFGGDPDNVTIFGESAGGVSTAIHMTMPVSRGLYDKAITQSGVGVYTKDSPSAFAIGEELAARLGCDQGDTAQCLRSLPPGALLAADIPGLIQGFLSLYLMMLNIDTPVANTFIPRVDGVLLPEDPTQAFQNGTYNRVPWMSGYTVNDMPFFKGGTIEAMDAVCQTSPYGVYGYQFEYDKHLLGSLFGGSHGMEIPFIFDTLDAFYILYGTFNLYTCFHRIFAQPLVDATQSYWANFAKTGDPNGQDLYGDDLPKWPAYEKGAGDAMMYLDLPLTPGPAQP